MPRELVHGRSQHGVDVTDPDDPKPARTPSADLDVHWDKDGGDRVSVNVVWQDGDEVVSSPAVLLDYRGCNAAVRVIRRARTGTFGSDE